MQKQISAKLHVVLSTIFSTLLVAGSASGDTIDLMWDRHPQSQVIGYVVHVGYSIRDLHAARRRRVDDGLVLHERCCWPAILLYRDRVRVKTSRRPSLERSVRLEQRATGAHQSRDAKLEGWTGSEPSARWQRPEGRCVDLQCDRPSARADADGVNRLCFGNSDDIGQLFGDGAGVGR